MLRVLEDQKEETRDDIRVGSKLCSLDNDRLRDSESPPVRGTPLLGHQPSRYCQGDPTEGGQPADHRDGNCGQIKDRGESLLKCGSAEGRCFIKHKFRIALHGAAPVEPRTVWCADYSESVQHLCDSARLRELANRPSFLGRAKTRPPTADAEARHWVRTGRYPVSGLQGLSPVPEHDGVSPHAAGSASGLPRRALAASVGGLTYFSRC